MAKHKRSHKSWLWLGILFGSIIGGISLIQYSQNPSFNPFEEAINLIGGYNTTAKITSVNVTQSYVAGSRPPHTQVLESYSGEIQSENDRAIKFSVTYPAYPSIDLTPSSSPPKTTYRKGDVLTVNVGKNGSYASRSSRLNHFIWLIIVIVGICIFIAGIFFRNWLRRGHKTIKY
jgi:hypothetical protein